MDTDKHLSPRVTIGIPVYNGEKFLEETLRSILNQTYENIEIIISDNASNDLTDLICRRFSSLDNRVKYYRNETNLGASQNYNKLVELATGQYFKWAASDDLMSQDYIEKCVDVLNDNLYVVLCYAKTNIIDESGILMGPYEDGLNLTSLSAVHRFNQLTNSIGECNAVFGLIRTEILIKTNLIGNYVGSDIVLLAELSLYGTFFEIQERLFFRRDHPLASSRNKEEVKQQEFFDPITMGRPPMRLWRHLYYYALSLCMSPINFIDKSRLLYSLLRSFIASRRGLAKEVFGYIKFKYRGFSN